MIGDHGKELLVFLCISLRKLLRKGLLGKSTLSRVARIRNTDCGGGQLTSPDCNEFGLGARRRCKSEADTTGIDNEVKLASTKSIHPLVPLNVDGDTGGVDGRGGVAEGDRVRQRRPEPRRGSLTSQEGA